MIRASLSLAAVGMVLAAGIVLAADKKQDDSVQATVEKVDAKANTVTVEMMDDKGKKQEKTFSINKDAKLLDSAGKTAKLDTFKKGDDVLLIQKDDKVSELRKHAEATITKVDAKAGTITVKMKDKDGKDVERTFRLVEETDYADSLGRVATIEVFQSGDDILVVEGEGKVKAMKKADAKQTAAKEKKEGTKGK